MSNPIEKLKPEIVWKHFYALTQIPRPSGFERKTIDYLLKFGKDLGLETIEDAVGNVIIRKPATKGMENRLGIIFQGHIDMVPQKNSDKVHDFEKDPIEPIIVGEWVKANGTTLGADNGLGCAAAMAVLESKDLVHGPVEALFTIDEETGMTGAFGLQPNILKGDILLNLDSEEEGELCIGCAGGTNANITFKYIKEVIPVGFDCYDLSVTGLKGGHSGVDIHLGRGNSNKILIRFLKIASLKYGARLASINGGSLRNAIPRESFAKVLIPSNNANALLKELELFGKIIKNEINSVDPDVKIELVFCKNCECKGVMDIKTQMNLIHAAYACPNGVSRMSADFDDLVETSNNLAIIKSENGEIIVKCLMRSSVDSAKEDLGEMIESVFTLAGAEVVFDGHYPGWKPNPHSKILVTMKSLYEKMYGKVPCVKAIHAGLECGLLGGVYPNFDMISFGPTIMNPHSPDEKAEIETVAKFWEYLVETLKNIPVK